nr:hypothetical protein Iba_chr03dCG6840 [Ipomoea batatas]
MHGHKIWEERRGTKYAYFGEGTLVIRLTSHITMDPKIQHTAKRTKKPAKMVANGGPWGTLLPSVAYDPFEGLGFDAKT